MFIGDDTQSEQVFSFLNNKKEKGSHLLKQNAMIYTCTIENKVS